MADSPARSEQPQSEYNRSRNPRSLPMLGVRCADAPRIFGGDPTPGPLSYPPVADRRGGERSCSVGAHVRSQENGHEGTPCTIETPLHPLGWGGAGVGRSHSSTDAASVSSASAKPARVAMRSPGTW